MVNITETQIKVTIRKLMMKRKEPGKDSIINEPLKYEGTQLKI